MSLDQTIEPGCTCDYCVKWRPWAKRVLEKLGPGEDSDLLLDFMDMEASHSEDAECANAKIAGIWPGWEQMKLRQEHKCNGCKRSYQLIPPPKHTVPNCCHDCAKGGLL